MTQRREPAEADDSTHYSESFMEPPNFRQEYYVEFNMKPIGGKNGQGKIGSINTVSNEVSTFKSGGSFKAPGATVTFGNEPSAPPRSFSATMFLQSPTTTLDIKGGVYYDMYVPPRVPIQGDTRLAGDGSVTGTPKFSGDLKYTTQFEMTTSDFLAASIRAKQGPQGENQHWLTYYTDTANTYYVERRLILPIYGRGTMGAYFQTPDGGVPDVYFNSYGYRFTMDYQDINFASVTYTQR